MENWKLLLPQGELEIKTSRQGSSTALLLAGGRKPASEWLVQIAASKDIYCADKGIECCCENNLKPVWLCGDADSAAKDCWEKAQLSGVKILLHDPLKDDTDLQLLLAAMPEAVNIVASGIWGGRFDHLYSNVFSLLNYKIQRDVQVVMADEQEILKNWIEESDNIVFFGGAGVSTESGIPDFRSQDGLYNQEYAYPPETIISHSFFMRNPEEFYRFYKNKMIFRNAKPNAAHLALAKLEQEGKLKAVITQNIDGLHQMAGSKNVLELHGSIHRNYCMRCGKAYGLEAVADAAGIPRCSCGGIIKPDVVLYEEGLDQQVLSAAVNAIRHADMLIIGGTSLTVYPAAGLVDYYEGTKLVLINKSVTAKEAHADLVITEPIGQVFQRCVLGEKCSEDAQTSDRR